MSSPMTGVLAAQATALPQPPAADKQGASKFDGVLADKAGAAPELGGAHAAQEVQASRPVAPVDAVGRTEQPVVHALSQVVRALEQGQRDLDRVIQAAGSGKPFSNAELLSLQASMYRYTQELDLMGKVVEKGTTGLKDLLKTQV